MTTINTRSLISSDPTITVPVEIELNDDGTAVARYEDATPIEYASVWDLERAHGIHAVDSHVREIGRAYGDQCAEADVAGARTRKSLTAHPTNTVRQDLVQMIDAEFAALSQSERDPLYEVALSAARDAWAGEE